MSEIEIILERIKQYMNILVDTLEKEGIKYFNRKPAVEIAHSGEDLKISLIDDNLEEIVCKFNQTPRKGKRYIFLNKKKVLDDSLDYSFNYLQVLSIKEELEEETAYNINIERVRKLIHDKHYAVALVFIISAFESVMSDLFYRYNKLWFDNEISKLDDYDDEIYKIFGNIMEDGKEKFYSYIKLINGKYWGIGAEKSAACHKWAKMKIKDYVYDCCKKINILNYYTSQLRSNMYNEIGNFEILKKILKTRGENYQGINFQSLNEKNGVTKVFNLFYKIDFNQLREDIHFFNEIIQKRHRIIHGKLKDSEIKLEEINNALDTLITIRGYVRDKLSQKEFEYERKIDFYL